jgi:hypothetical protein
MTLTDKETIFKRFDDAIYDISVARIAKRNGDGDKFIKHTKDAGEAMSQALEYALKYHLNKALSAQEKTFLRHKSDLSQLIEKYVDQDGGDNGYFFNTINDEIQPSVNFNFLLKNKKNITNASKHEGANPDFDVQVQYIAEVRKFINQYVDEHKRLKSFEDFENIDLSTWDLLYSACDRFAAEERNYILIIGPNENIDRNYLQNISIPNWNLIIDFDFNSESNGFYDCSYKNAEVSPHKIKAADLVDINSFSRYSQSHYHYFANNYKGSGAAEPRDYLDWHRKYGRNTEILLKSFSEVFTAQKNIVVVLYNSRKYINFLCEKIDSYFGSNTTFVFANDIQDELAVTCEDFNGIKVNITIPEIAEGFANFSSNFGFLNPFNGQYLVPFLESSETKDVTGILPADTFSQLEEYFEVLHKGLPLPTETAENPRTFLNGENQISWAGLKHRFDVERSSVIKKYVKQVEKAIETGRGKIFLVHDAGFGGTTVARRIAWEIHNDYPTLILKNYRDVKVKEKIIDLHQRTRKTILIVMEVPQAITLDEVDNLYKSIPQARPIVFLVVKRGKPVSNNDMVISDWGNDTVDLVNSYKPYLEEYKDVAIQQKKGKRIR